jgi:hypothetical protein
MMGWWRCWLYWEDAGADNPDVYQASNKMTGSYGGKQVQENTDGFDC